LIGATPYRATNSVWISFFSRQALRGGAIQSNEYRSCGADYEARYLA